MLNKHEVHCWASMFFFSFPFYFKVPLVALQYSINYYSTFISVWWPSINVQTLFFFCFFLMYVYRRVLCLRVFRFVYDNPQRDSFNTVPLWMNCCLTTSCNLFVGLLEKCSLSSIQKNTFIVDVLLTISCLTPCFLSVTHNPHLMCGSNYK